MDNMDINIKQGENAQQYLWRIGNLKDEGIITLSWDALTPILNSNTGIIKNRDNWRKEYSIVKRYYENVFSNQTEIPHAKLFDAEIRKKQAQTLNTLTNKMVREVARDGLLSEELIQAIDNLCTTAPLSIPKTIPKNRGDRVGVLCFGDEHFGTEFTIYGLYGEVLNEYNEQVFLNRMSSLYNQAVDIINQNSLTDLYVFTFGDFADGIIRTSQLMRLEYGIIESTIKYAEYLSRFLNDLTSIVRVHFQTTPGNHTELRLLGQKKGTFKNENMELVVRAFVKERLKDNPNFDMKENKSNYIFENIYGYTFVGVHGEVSGTSKVVQEFAVAYDTPINYFLAGHRHHKQCEEIGNDVEYIGIPSLIGIDPYAISLPVTSNPGAVMLIVEDGVGLTSQNYIKL